MSVYIFVKLLKTTSLKPVSQFDSNVIWHFLGVGEGVCSNGHFPFTKMTGMPIYLLGNI